jgi:hypothetical protein
MHPHQHQTQHLRILIAMESIPYIILGIALLSFAISTLSAHAGNQLPRIDVDARSRELATLDALDVKRGSIGAFDRFDVDVEDGGEPIQSPRK